MCSAFRHMPVPQSCPRACSCKACWLATRQWELDIFFASSFPLATIAGPHAAAHGPQPGHDRSDAGGGTAGGWLDKGGWCCSWQPAVTMQRQSLQVQVHLHAVSCYHSAWFCVLGYPSTNATFPAAGGGCGGAAGRRGGAPAFCLSFAISCSTWSVSCPGHLERLQAWLRVQHRFPASALTQHSLQTMHCTPTPNTNAGPHAPRLRWPRPRSPHRILGPHWCSRGTGRRRGSRRSWALQG